jgi:cell division protein FtsZ
MSPFEKQQTTSGAKIRVLGVGGGGGNALNTMINSELDGVDFICVNTDLQALEANQASVKIQIGALQTKGLGAGANPEAGWKAANEDQSRIAEAVAGSDMVFVTAGMGGGTGTGAAPVIARLAHDSGALTVGVVTRPFDFEGKQRHRRADEGIRTLGQEVDTLIVIPNQRLVGIADKNMPLMEAFRRADDVLLNAVRGISDLITTPGLINVDFADVRTIMSTRGLALMGTGVGRGENRALDAAQQAISSPLLEDTNIEGAQGILINVTGGSDLTLHEINQAVTLVQEAAHDDANIIFGTVIDNSMKDAIMITVVATGFQQLPSQVSQAAAAQAARRASRPVERHVQQGPYIQPERAVAPPHRGAPEPAVFAAETKTPPDLDRPAYLRGQQAEEAVATTEVRRSGFHRDPLTHNPFIPSDQSEFDTPTFLRK